MSPERRARAVEFLRSFSDDVLREAASELESLGQEPAATAKALEAEAVEFVRRAAIVETRPEDRRTWTGRALTAFKLKAQQVLAGASEHRPKGERP